MTTKGTTKRNVYVTPCLEIYKAEHSELLAGTAIFTGDAGNGEFGYSAGGDAGNGEFDNFFGGGSGSAGQGNLTTVTGAKVFGPGFTFSNPWED